MIFVDACFGKQTPHTPIWMMRQAGRYLNEYMAVRAKAGDFLTMCRTPELACEVTLQPMDILDVDAAILFSDILVVPMEMGVHLEFIKGEGPKLSTIREQSELDKLDMSAASKLNYVYDAISLIRERLDPDKALIGFAGAPWTLATYMMEGQGSKNYAVSKKLVYSNPEFVKSMLSKLTEVLKNYLSSQIEAGANAVMLFDSWANALEKDAYIEFGWSYLKEVGEYIKAKYPHIPVMLFPKGVGEYLDVIDGNFDVFGVDWSTPLDRAKKALGEKYVLQGNLEPCRLYDKKAMIEGVEKIVEIMGKDGRHIFNLGHGMLPDLPRENAIELVKVVKELTKR